MGFDRTFLGLSADAGTTRRFACANVTPCPAAIRALQRAASEASWFALRFAYCCARYTATAAITGGNLVNCILGNHCAHLKSPSTTNLTWTSTMIDRNIGSL